jgi:hypothetical protein
MVTGHRWPAEGCSPGAECLSMPRRTITYVVLTDSSEDGEQRELYVNREAIDYVGQDGTRGTKVRLRSGEELLVADDVDHVLSEIGASPMFQG